MYNDYVFNAMSGVADDSCYKSQRNIQNVHSGTYQTTNYFANDCDMRAGLDFALSQPSVNYTGGHNTDAKGSNIENNSKLLIGSVQTNPKCRISLEERPYKTIPYLGRGVSNPELESKLQQGDQITNKKSVNTVTEMSHIPLRHTPMLDPLRHSITNPEKLIESVADQNWVRGGMDTRDLFKEKSN